MHTTIIDFQITKVLEIQLIYDSIFKDCSIGNGDCGDKKCTNSEILRNLTVGACMCKKGTYIGEDLDCLGTLDSI